MDIHTEYVKDILNDLYYDEMVKYHSSSSRNEYFITSYGRFICVSKYLTKRCECPHRFLKLTPTTNHKLRYHHQVRLPDGTKLVHREVGKHFLQDFDPDLFVCHYDEEAPLPYRHHVDNLWMGTPSENLRDAYAKGRKTWSNQTYKHLA